MFVGNEVIATTLAIVMGAVIALVLFVPFVAISYRRRGRITAGRTLVWVAALVYFCAIWTYTLIPLPDPDDLVCVGKNTDLWQAVRDVQGAAGLTDPVILQLVFNVALFVPLGFFIRVLGGRPLPTAFVAGLGTSVFIELTQLTGLWGIYDCAYRVFDVDDMLTNTVGAVIGSIVALIVPKQHRGLESSPDALAPRPVTKARRIVAAVCDLLAATVCLFLIYLAGAAWMIVVQRHAAVDADLDRARAVAIVTTFVIWAVVVAVTGRTVGEHAVALEYRGGVPEWLARPLRLLTGIGGYLLLNLIGSGAAAGIFAAVSAITIVATEHGRGLPGLVTGRRVVDSRESP